MLWHQALQSKDYEKVSIPLTTRNVLLSNVSFGADSSALVAKVGDFGLSRYFDSTRKFVNNPEGIEVPWPWIAPEHFESNKFYLTSDVWSFGVLFWEVASLGQRTPYQYCINRYLLPQI